MISRVSHRVLLVSGLVVLVGAVGTSTATQVPYPRPAYPTGYPGASVRLEVMPRDAEVFVDGYFTGIVDEFDGMWQRLRLEPGQHEITLYRDGYRTYHQEAYLTNDHTFKIKMQMQPLAAGDAPEPRPAPKTPLPGRQLPRPLPEGQEPRPLPEGGTPQATEPRTGQLTIRLEPADASLTVDGQAWPIDAGASSVTIDLPEGTHVIQVRKTGFVGFLREVDIRGGETATVSVTLRSL
jgi:PEGA domain-containing protein